MNIDHFLKSRTRVYLAAFCAYLAVALVITYPIIANLQSHFIGFVYGDAYEMAHHVWWFKYALQTGEPLFYQSMLGYPEGIEGITLWAHPLQFFPAWLLAFVMPLPVALNSTIIVTLALNGLAMFALACHVIARIAPALLAGVIFMAYPTIQGHLGATHAGLLVQWTLPLYVLALLHLQATGSRKQLLIVAAAFVIATFGHTLQVIYALMPIVTLFGITYILRRDWGALGRFVLAHLIGSVLLVLFLLPVASATFGSAAYTDEGGGVRYSADVLAPVTPSFFHPLFGQLDYTHRVLGVNIDEGAAYIGVLAVLLAIVALWKTRAARWWGILALIVYVLSLGALLKVFDSPLIVNVGGVDTHIVLPWAVVEHLPVFSLARTPARFNFVLGLAVALLAGYGAAVVFARRSRVVMAGAVVVLSAFVLYEYQLFWTPPDGTLQTPAVPLASAHAPDAIRALRDRDDIRAVFNVPWDNLIVAKHALFLQTEHEQALVAGHVTRRTPVNPAMLTLLEAVFEPSHLDAVGADVVMVHREYDVDATLFERAKAQLGDPVYQDAQLAVFETPRTDAAPDVLILPTTPRQITQRAESYVYAPAPTWIELDAVLRADQRVLALEVDGVRVHEWFIDGETHVQQAIPLAGGYHALALVADPACPPSVPSASLQCRGIQIDSIMLTDAATDYVSATFAQGVRLNAASVRADEGAVWLAWAFDDARHDTDIRYVHVLDGEGKLVAQNDQTLGERAANSAMLETVHFPEFADLPAGEYRVVVGWYTYPDITQFGVIAPETPNPFMEIATFTRE